jgi:hypothetical protein
MNTLNCAPNTKGSDDYTCFKRDELTEIAAAFNRLGNQKPIDIETKNKRELWKSINKRLQNVCNKEWCWAEQEFVSLIPDKGLQQKIRHFTFKPRWTKGRFSWLDTTDINLVLQQYEDKYNGESFKFLGALPCDFFTQVDMNYSDLTTYQRVGIVFNLDKHNQRGSHWVAFFIDNTAKTLEYFDSLGDAPNGYIKRFIKTLRSQKKFSDYNILVNRMVHQRQNSECGVYSIYYIIQRLRGKDFRTLIQTAIPDSKMNRFRKHIFTI